VKRAKTKSTVAPALRQQAEEKLSRKRSHKAAAMSEADVRALVHELQVHQIELEMQNEELLRAQAEAQEAADKFSELFDFAPVGYFVLDKPGLIRQVNLAGAALLGLDRHRVVGQRFQQYIAADDRADYDAFCRKVRQAETKQTCELKLLKPGQGRCEVLVEGIVDQAERGDRQGWRLAVIDVTARKLAEAAVHDSEARLAGIVGSAMDAVISVDAGQRVVFFNGAAAEMFGCSAAAALGQRLDRFIPARYRHRHREHVSGFGATGKTGRAMGALGLLSALRADGQEFPIEASISHGEVRGQKLFSVILRDITERKRYEETLRKMNEVLEQRVMERTAGLRDKARFLEQSEERYRSLVAASAQMIWTTNPAGEVGEDLPTWRAFTGQSYEEIKGWGWASALHPDDLERTKAVWTHSVATRTLYEIEYRVRRKDGEYRHFAVRGVPVIGKDGIICEWTGACTDITEHKAAEERRNTTHALLALFARKSSSHEYLEAVVEAIRAWTDCQCLGIRVVDEDGDIPYSASVGFDAEFLRVENRLSLNTDNCCCVRAISQAIEEQDRPLLTPGGSLRCDNTTEFVSQLSPQEQARYRGNCVNARFASVAVIPIRYHDRILGALHFADRRPSRFALATVQFLESMAPLIGEAIHRFQTEAELARHRDHLGELVKQRTADLEGANAQLHTEIAQREDAEEALRRAARDLERSNADLEQFASIASHDLQEPLRAVSGYVRLLQRRLVDKLDAKALEHITGVVDGAARMEKLISDLLAFSRIGAQGGDFRPADLNALLGDALNNLQASIKATHAKVTTDPLPTIPVNASQVTRLFQNLIGNAIKFRGERPPEIHIGARQEQAQWRFEVRDNGIGIDPQHSQRIFQIFQRLHTRKEYPGTGIGLAVCKKIVERHGGTIWVESNPGEGSTFCFSIPARSVLAAAAQRPPA
jgi:PAS domain S-box-containing protein